jgi:hypothetical protein
MVATKRTLLSLLLFIGYASADLLDGWRRYDDDGRHYTATSDYDFEDYRNYLHSAGILISTLREARFTSLATFFETYPRVLRQVAFTTGQKTLLAPTNEAMQSLPRYCLGNTTCYESVILMHFLAGTFNLNELQADPRHTIGHSLLTNRWYVNLPGGNGQAVALSVARNSQVRGLIGQGLQGGNGYYSHGGNQDSVYGA